MVVAGVILMIILLGMMIPRKYIFFYTILSGIMISSLYFFIEPSYELDLYRHYQVLEIINEIPISDIIFNKNIQVEMPLAQLYLTDYPVYCIILKVFSYMGNKKILAFFVSIISYGIPLYFINKTFNRKIVEKWKVLFVLSFLLFNMDFLSISGIRNILVTSLFTLLLYKDIVENKNKIVCFFGYILLCSIHSIGVVFLGLRICLYLYRKINPKFATILFLLFFVNMKIIALLTIKYLDNQNSIYKAANSFLVYLEGGTPGSFFVQGSTAVLYLMCFIICIFCEKHFINEKYRNWYQYLIINFLFIISVGVKSVDIFMRFGLILYVLMIPLLCEQLQQIDNYSIKYTITNIREYVDRYKMKLTLNNKNSIKQKISTVFESSSFFIIICCLEMLLSFVFNIYVKYYAIDACIM